MAGDSTQKRLIIQDLRGGRNGTDPPLSIGETQCLEAINVEWFHATLARKRQGAQKIALTGGTPAFTISWLGRFVPSVSEQQAEMWECHDTFPPAFAKMPATTSSFTGVTCLDNPTGNAWDVQGQSLKNKFFLAFQNAQNRMHTSDYGSGTIRRTGIAAPAVPGGATDSGGGGLIPAVQRFYRFRAITISSGVTIRRSEPGPSLAFTPSGLGASVHVTTPAAPGE